MTFAHGINAGFGDPIPDERLAALSARRFNLVRTSIHKPALRDRCVRQLEDTGMGALYIVTALDDIAAIPPGDGTLQRAVELGNEPMLEGGELGTHAMTPQQYVAWAWPLFDAAKRKGLRVYCGAIYTIDDPQLRWLRDVLTLCPSFEYVAVHRYPFRDDQRPERSRYGSRARERLELSKILAHRRCLITETGNTAHAYRQWWRFWQTQHVTEAQRLDYAKQEIAYWRSDLQCDGVVWYQEQTGNPPTDPAGIRGPDLAWYPVGNMWL